MDPKLLTSIVNVSSGRCFASEVFNPHPGVVPTAPASRGYSGGFGSALILKVRQLSFSYLPRSRRTYVTNVTQDLNLAIDLAKASDSPLPLGSETVEMYTKIVESGLAEKDFSVAYAYLGGKKVD